MSKWRFHQLEEWVNKYDWRFGAELGIWRGKSYLYLLEHCPKLTLIGVDLWMPQERIDDKKIGSESYKDWDHELYEREVREAASKFGERSIIYKMYTHEAAELVADKSLDFVFIDADHTYEGVLRDIKAWRPKIKPGGYLTGHDINWQSVLKAVKEECPHYSVGHQHTWIAKA